MAQHELATTIDELPQAIKRLQAKKLPKRSTVRIIWEDEQTEKKIEGTGHTHIDKLFADLDNIEDLSPEAQQEFDESRGVFRDSFNL